MSILGRAQPINPNASPNDALPCPPCMGTPEAIEEFKQLKDSVRRIETALVGDEAVGQRGIVPRINTVERIILVLGGCIIFLGGEKVLKLFF